MYFFGWILMVALTVLSTLAAFIWALRSGQFSDQGRARYLPLVDEPLPKVTDHALKPGKGIYLFLFIGLLVLAAMAAALILSLTHWKGS